MERLKVLKRLVSSPLAADNLDGIWKNMLETQAVFRPTHTVKVKGH